MLITNEVKINAPRKVVYDCLNDLDVLATCIPGCEEIEWITKDCLKIKVALKVGPVKVKFFGTVVLKNDHAPEQFSLTGEGKGGAAGFASGDVDFSLIENKKTTILKYGANVKIGGKIIQLGNRLLKGSVTNLTSQFFLKFSEIVSNK